MQRRNASNPVPVTPAEAPVPSSTDTGILSFGTSASANDERRRSIISGVEDIEKSCTKIVEFTKLEKNTGEQGMKDRSHGYNENTALFRGASEMLDSLNMSDQVRIGLEEALKGKLACKLNPQDSDGISLDNVNNKENSRPTGHHSIGSIQKNYRRKLGEVDELSVSWEQGSRSLGAAMTKKRAVEEEVAASRAQMETGHTLDRLVKEKENTKVYQKTLNEVLQRMSFENSNIEAAQARNEQVETEERGVLAAFGSKKKAHAIEQAETAKLLVAAEEKQQRENKLLAALEAELAGLSLHSDMEKNLGSIESFCFVREEKKRELGETRVERTALFAKSSDLGSKLTAVKASMDVSTRAILQQKEIQLEIEAKKAANDEVEFTKVVKGRVEFEETSKVKEKLSKLTNDFAQEHESLFKILDESKNNLGLLQEEQSIVLKEIDEKHASLQEPKRILDEHNVEFTKDYEAELALIEQYTEKASVERERTEDVRKHTQFERKIHVLQYGAQLLEMIREEEKKYTLADIEFWDTSGVTLEQLLD